LLLHPRFVLICYSLPHKKGLRLLVKQTKPLAEQVMFFTITASTNAKQAKKTKHIHKDYV